MRVSIMQPAYLPWGGYVQRIMKSDLHIILDHVQLGGINKTQFTHRNRILTNQGALWLTLPVCKDSSLPISSLRLNRETKWPVKHSQSLRHNYGKSIHYAAQASFWGRFYSEDFEFLIDAIEASSAYLLGMLDCNTPRVKSSMLGVLDTKADLILNLCRVVNASVYISGPFGRSYLDVAAFERAGIEVVFHDFIPKVYPQTQPGFVPNLSIVDMLFNIGPKAAHALLSE